MNCHFGFSLCNNIELRSFFRSSEGGFFVVRVTETNNAYLCRTENLMSKVMLKALHLTYTSEEKDIQNKYVVHKFHFTFLCSPTNFFMK